MCIYRVDVAHLSLYNLSVIHKKKYFDSELELMAFINENWDRLQLGEVRLVSSRPVSRDVIERLFQHHFFTSSCVPSPAHRHPQVGAV